MDLYNNYTPYGETPPQDPLMTINERRRNERKGLNIAATKLGCLLLLYYGLTRAMNYVYYFVLYLAATGELSLDINEVAKYLSQNAEKYSSSYYSMLGNLSIVLTSLIITMTAARFIFRVSLMSMLRPEREHFTGGVKWFTASMSVNVIVSMIVGILVTILGSVGITVPESDFSISDSSTATLIMQFLYVIAIGPVCEEFIYRGVIITLLKPYGKGLAVFFSAFIFGFMHGNLPQFAATFAGGLVFAAVAVKYDSIVPTLVMHILNNIAASIYDFTDVLGVSRNTASQGYYTIVIICLIIGSYMLIVKGRELKPEEESSFTLTASQRKITVFINIAMLVYFCILFVGYIRSFMVSNM